MQRDVLQLSWEDFDCAADWLAQRVKDLPLTHIYGQPRGGLPLAVALSHRLGVPLVQCPSAWALWVDDIVDQGKTITRTKNQHVFAGYVCWVSRRERPDLIQYLTLRSDVWVLFPWEVPDKATQDALVYQKSRQLNLEV